MPRPSPQEFWLLKLLLTEDESLVWARAHIELDWIQHPVLRAILVERLGHDELEPASVATLLGRFPEPQAQNLISEAASEQRPIPNRKQQIMDLARRLRDQFIDRKLGALLQRLKLPNLTDEQRLEMLREQQTLRVRKREPLEG